MIQVEQTPNPNSLKFLSQKILSKVGTEEFKKSNLNNIKVPFIKENIMMGRALKTMNKFNLGVLVVRNNYKKTSGIISDGDIKRISEKSANIKNLIAKKIMKKNPLSVNKDMLATQALSIMNSKKVTCLCVHNKKLKNKTIGILTVHNILNANIR